ncbi:protein piccolo-like protein [Lasius niger]|uniref:Protein piccolo-like protein n=1 Tax=Lasius niger TaxID=67767 RepID=A0A0J7NC33_LASNI|nr:protein piccolo-like protein [Lasius niger]
MDDKFNNNKNNDEVEGIDVVGGEEEEVEASASTSGPRISGPRSSRLRVTEIRKVSVRLQKIELNSAPTIADKKGEREDREKDLCLPNSEAEILLPQKGKRGRPESKGDYARKKMKKEEDARKKEGKEEREMLDANIPIPDSMALRRMEEKAEELREEFREALTADVAAEALRHATVIKKWALKSKNLKGRRR